MNVRKISAYIKYMLLASIVLPLCTMAGAILNVPSTGISTISLALIKARPGDTVLVDDGTYNERIFLKAGVILKARNMHRATIDGKGRGTVVQMGPNTSIIGFVVRNGTIGIFTKSSGISILQCMVTKNWMTGVMSVRHLPQIEDNVISFNRASGFQGWDVRTSVSSMNHNTIAYNGNHGVACGGKSNLIVENNVIAFNERFAFKINSETERNSKIVANNIYKNLPSLWKTPEGNYSFDPAFMSPRVGSDFKPDPKYCCQIKSADNENLGARLYY
ncbi:MAG: right-handed parallel beta-helix repeat-containing protein [Chitinivibrionales bacterium]|nr:right-handed parallel beta-helix repeat-containing protein [Chitinivibrionales bacterium]